MTRSPQEVFQHHARSLGAGDLDEIVADCTDDAVFITPAGVRRGKDGIRTAFTQLLADVLNAANASQASCSWRALCSHCRTLSSECTSGGISGTASVKLNIGHTVRVGARTPSQPWSGIHLPIVAPAHRRATGGKTDEPSAPNRGCAD
jgi:hypothetical protein